MKIKRNLIVLDNAGNVIHTEKHGLKQFENNFDFAIACNVWSGAVKGTIQLSFKTGDGEYPLQFATFDTQPYIYNGVEYDLYVWRGLQDVTLYAPNENNLLLLSILANDYNGNVFSTIEIDYNVIQSLQNNEIVGQPNSVESLSYELNNTNEEVQKLQENFSGLLDGTITVEQANKDSQGNVIHETYATIETVDELTKQVTINEDNIDILIAVQETQNERLNEIESEQVEQNTNIENNRGNIQTNRDDIDTNTSNIQENANLIESNRLNAESRIPKDLTDYNFKTLLQDNDIILIKQDDGNFKRILAKDFITQLGTQTDLYKGQFTSLEALRTAYPDGIDHGFIAGTYATIDAVGQSTFNAVWDVTDLKWVANDVSGYVPKEIYLLEQNEQNTKINDVRIMIGDVDLKVFGLETKAEEIEENLNYHIYGSSMHVSRGDREEWDDKPSNATFNAHVNDSIKHITSVERDNWNNKVNASDLTDLDLINEVALKEANLFNPFAFYEIGDYNSINEDGSLVLYSSSPNGTVRIVFVDEKLVQTGNSSEVNGSAVTIPANAFALYLYAGGTNAKYAKYEINDLNLKGGDIVYVSLNVREVNPTNVVVDEIMVSEYNIPYHPFNEDIINNLTSTSTTKAASANMVRVLNENKINKTDIATTLEIKETNKVASAYLTHILELNKLGYNAIIDNLTSTETNKVLSANMGKALKEEIERNKPTLYTVNKQLHSGPGLTENTGPSLQLGVPVDFDNYTYDIEFLVYETGWSSAFTTLTFNANNQRQNAVLNLGVTTPTYNDARNIAFTMIFKSSGEVELFFLSTNYNIVIEVSKVKATPYRKGN